MTTRSTAARAVSSAVTINPQIIITEQVLDALATDAPYLVAVRYKAAPPFLYAAFTELQAVAHERNAAKQIGKPSSLGERHEITAVQRIRWAGVKVEG